MPFCQKPRTEICIPNGLFLTQLLLPKITWQWNLFVEIWPKATVIEAIQDISQGVGVSGSGSKEYMAIKAKKAKGKKNCSQDNTIDIPEKALHYTGSRTQHLSLIVLHINLMLPEIHRSP